MQLRFQALLSTFVRVNGFSFFLISILLFVGTSLYAQKVEREYQLDSQEVPDKIHHSLEELFPDRKKVRYYLDVNEIDSTVEAKFSDQRRRTSVEFSIDGDWLDTEIDIPIKEVPASAWGQLCSKYGVEYDKWRVYRVQEHTGASDNFYYEVEVKTFKDFVWDRRQVKLSTQGEILEDLLIKLAPGHLDRW